ncbi:MAG: alpha/beta hydrolase-fold protein [Terriglobia bacterium]
MNSRTFLLGVVFAIASRSATTPAVLDPSKLNPADVKKGVAVLEDGPDYLWAVDAETRPTLFVDGKAVSAMKQTRGKGPWVYRATLPTGTMHSFYYMIGGKKFGGMTDIPAFGPDSYSHPGVPQGRLSEPVVLMSKLYPGMKTEYRVYIPAQYDAATPAALMIWQDGHYHFERDGPLQIPPTGQPPSRLQNVIDNLTNRKEIPVAIYLLIDPGTVGATAMRSIQYDTVSDLYPRFLRDEILPDLYAKYNIRKDGYSHAIAGNSSGGICAFNAAWYMPELFSRVVARIPSFTSLQWKPGTQDGGNIYPFRVRREPKRNIRVWLQDGSEDMESPPGSWPLQSLQMANSLKIRGYDFHLTFGSGTHNHSQNNSEMPAVMKWIWRDYDAAKTDQAFEQDATEKAKPVFRVKIYNRD